jgi:hypothetical protein
VQQAVCAPLQSNSPDGISRAAGGVVAPSTEFFYCHDFQARGPRILLLAHTWRPAMRVHYGIVRPAFYRRPARATELAKYANGHPWGWSYAVQEVLLDEMRWLSPEELDGLRLALDLECRDALRCPETLEQRVPA